MKYIFTLFIYLFLSESLAIAGESALSDTKNDTPSATSKSKIPATEKADKKGDTKLPLKVFDVHPSKSIKTKTEKATAKIININPKEQIPATLNATKINLPNNYSGKIAATVSADKRIRKTNNFTATELANNRSKNTKNSNVLASKVKAELNDTQLSNSKPVIKNTSTSKKRIPTEFNSLDLNKNNNIEIDEVYQTIDRYFDNTIKVSIETINNLIDYFFEQ